MAESKVFVDSNFCVAIFNPQDTLHLEATIKSQKVQKEKNHLVISNYIFLEVVTVLSQRVDRRTAITFGKHLLEDNQIEIIHIDQKLNDSAWKIFQKIDKKNFSFVDCSSLVVLGFAGIKKFLTFDKDDFKNLTKEYNFTFY